MLATTTIKGSPFYFFESEDLVIQALKDGVLFGEAAWTTLCRFLVDEGSTIVDCGAHIGTFSHTPAVAGRRVILIDGAEKNIECLKRTFDGLANVRIHHAILLDGAYSCSFSKAYGPFGSVSSVGSGDRQSTTLDTILSSYNEQIGGVKFDVEGNELEAIAGARQTIERFRPTLLVEVNGYCLRLKNKRPRDLFAVLESMGYVSFIPHEDDKLVTIDKDELFPYAVTDVVAIHRQEIYRYLPRITFVRSLARKVLHNMMLENFEISDDAGKEYLKAAMDESFDEP